MYAHAHTHLHARTHACVHAHACTRTHTHTHKLLDIGLNISTSVHAELCFFSSVALFTWSMRQQVTQAVKFWHVHYTYLFELPCLHEVCSNSRSPKLSSYWSLLYSAILRFRADSLRSHVILHEWIAFYSAFLNIHRSDVLTALAWLVPHETAAISARSVYTIQPCTMSLHAKPHL